MSSFYDDISMYTMKTKKIFREIGLNELETECYLALVQRSPLRASSLARSFDMPKATVLLALGRLVDHFGIVRREKKKNYYHFFVEDVNALVKHLDKKIERERTSKRNVEDLLPELRSMQTYEISKPKILYYEGKEGIRQAFEMVLSEADDLVAYGNNEDEIKKMSNIFPDYYRRRVEKKIPVSKALAAATDFNVKETLENAGKQLRNTRLLPKEWAFPIQFNIYKDTVIFYSFEEYFALVVKNRPIAACLKMVFGLAFEQAAEYDHEIRAKFEKDKKMPS